MVLIVVSECLLDVIVLEEVLTNNVGDIFKNILDFSNRGVLDKELDNFDLSTHIDIK